MLSQFPRVSLAHLPTPLEHLPNLSAHLGGPEIYVKRDDCTGLASGGNKTRKLEFVMADAQQQRADTVITVGAVQSNHVRQTAAAACKLGMQCEILLEHRIEDPSEVYTHSGNVFLDRIFGAAIREYPAGTDFDAEMQALAEELRSVGRKPYVIAGGASNKIGALGYVQCAHELLSQANERELVIDQLVTASGSAGTHAGLIVGLKSARSDIPLLGIGVGAPKSAQEEKVFRLAVKTAAYVGAPGCVNRQDVIANCDYIGQGYGIPTDAMNEAVKLFARLEGLLLDPVYTGKAFAGAIDLIRRGEFADANNIVLLHTGGSAGLFAYADQMTTHGAL